MWPLPKKLFQWKEPCECRRALQVVEAANQKWWMQPCAALLIAAVLLSHWVLAGCNPNKQPLPFVAALPLSFGGGLLFAYAIPWLLSLCPAYIMVFPDRLYRVVGDTNQAWKWADIKAYGWRDCGEYELLVLEHRRGNQVLVGVPRTVSRLEFVQFLTGHGLNEVHAGPGGASGSSAVQIEGDPIPSGRTSEPST